jgi:UDP-N-acetylmuramyl tripeptide synthase
MVDDQEYTTPDSVTINHYLSQMVAADVEYCFMEVSSHGIHQKEQKHYTLPVAYLLIYLTII